MIKLHRHHDFPGKWLQQPASGRIQASSRLIRIACGFALLAPIALSCLSCESNARFPNEALALTRSIEVAVESSPELNTPSFYVDFTQLGEIGAGTIDSCLLMVANTTQVNSDSLFKHDEEWLRKKQLGKTLILFEELKRKGDLVTVRLSKIRAAEAGVGVEIILRSAGGGFSVVDRRVIWVS